MSVSVGAASQARIANAADPDEVAADLQKRADAALYQAKANGRNAASVDGAASR